MKLLIEYRYRLSAAVLLLLVQLQAANGGNSSSTIQQHVTTPQVQPPRPNPPTLILSRLSHDRQTRLNPQTPPAELGGVCASKSSCKTRGRRLELAGGRDKRPCYCDANCNRYDDCCPDSPWAKPIDQRTDKTRLTRLNWHCHRINDIFGDILLRANCSSQWLSEHRAFGEGESTRRRCEYMHKQRARGKHAPAEQEADPVGMMMPITDLTSGITYANSYCLRCNGPLLEQSGGGGVTDKAAPPKLVFWSPLLECNYNLDNDDLDRNNLIDLISKNKGQALHFSPKHNRWVIDVGPRRQRHQQPSSNRSEQSCTITPTIPDSLDHMIRFCKTNTIDTCPMVANKTALTREVRQVRAECELGHQSLVYGQISNLVYWNLACATCNNDTNVFCEPRLAKKLPGGPVMRIVGDKQQPDRIIHPPDTDTEPDTEDEETDISTLGAGRGGHAPGTAISGSFSVLLDLYSSSQSDEQVGAVHSCPDPASQVYDPFYLTCRDIVCGLHHRMLDGNCVPAREVELVRSSLVEKFGPAMAQVTTICLLISIASLTMYLFLYVLSMLDLRHMLVDMAQWERLNHNPLEEQRGSKASMASGRSHSQTQSQNLSSRGVACLAASLLAAYLLFIVGHQQAEESDQEDQSPGLGCRATAVATYYFFLLAFAWMFMLSYDIWRILRLATCQLRAPVLHSQTGRFLAYTLFTQLIAGIIVASSVLVDVAPLACQPVSSDSMECGLIAQHLSHFIRDYRPRFGHHLGSCWFSNRRSLALFFGLPVAIIMLSNVIFFIHSSYMVICNSTGSSKPQKSGSGSPKPTSMSSQKSGGVQHPPLESSISSISADMSQRQLSCDQSNASAQTLQTHLSEESSSGEDSPQPQAFHSPPHILSEAPKRRLEQTQSSGSLATNQSISSGTSSITANLALKYDTHLQTLGLLMGSIVKDYRLYCRLSTIMGLTWLTGLMASIVDKSETLWYLFVVLNTLQGLFIFIAFGCKRSKLSNLEILLDYIQFSWQKRFQAKKQASKPDIA